MRRDIIRISFSFACDKVKKTKELKSAWNDVLDNMIEDFQADLVFAYPAELQFVQQFEYFKSASNSFNLALEDYINAMQDWAESVRLRPIPGPEYYYDGEMDIIE